MQVIAYAGILAIVAPVSVLTFLVFTGDRAGLRNIQANLGRKTSSDPRGGDFKERLTYVSQRLTPKGYAGWLDKQLAGAGRPKEWPLGRIIMIKPMLALVGAGLGFLFFMSSPKAANFLILIAVTALSYFIPDLLIRSSAQKRREAIRTELPNALDQMLISVQAGLGFEMAMGRAGTNGTGPLADELIRTLQDIQVGRSRKDAYLAMSERIDVPDVRSFIRAVVQADAYGIAIAGVLKAQARDMRVKRKQRAEEHAMKMPVKMLFPLIFFILPTLFVVVLGPTVLSIMEMFSQGAT
ncbi:type II secretion system F family protein [Pseudarthrobacter cellobiosi]|uniref:type II secretion system F family protein n=1 Tax=Pseudarthrobacter cellobiosi TaxID=2953654 RepID=UPI00208FE250|nr:type II secretion system F family protein [Pseudarthrobacter sp. HLT1-5]MCO4256762.1 type II secretion system F family protein [Pseudarthrobacter sp. HLT1-5]MCO4275100.1 type II secretion system F family protein [Pseudarthrobacter sp. HLT3-5]